MTPQPNSIPDFGALQKAVSIPSSPLVSPTPIKGNMTYADAQNLLPPDAPSQPGIMDNLATDSQNREQQANDIKSSLGKVGPNGVAINAGDVGTQLFANAVGGIINDPVNEAMNSLGLNKVVGLIGKGTDEAASGMGSFLRNLVGANNADEVGAKSKEFVSKFLDHPIFQTIRKMADDPQITGDLNAMSQVAQAAGTVVGAKEVGGGMGDVLTTAGNKASAGIDALSDRITPQTKLSTPGTTDNFTQDATPAYNKNLIGERGIKNEDGTITPRVQEGGTISGRTVNPTPLEKEAGQALSKVPNYPTEGTALEKYQSIQPRLDENNSEFKTSLGKETVMKTRGEMTQIVKDAVNKVPDKSLLLSKTDPVIKNYLRVASNAVEGIPQTLEGEYKYSNLLDGAYENARGKLAFNSDRLSALDEVHTAVRDALKQDLIDSAQSTDVKSYLKNQWDLYRASDVLRGKAESEAGSTVGRFMQNHPLATKAIHTAANAIGVGAAVKAAGEIAP